MEAPKVQGPRCCSVRLRVASSSQSVRGSAALVLHNARVLRSSLECQTAASAAAAAGPLPSDVATQLGLRHGWPALIKNPGPGDLGFEIAEITIPPASPRPSNQPPLSYLGPLWLCGEECWRCHWPRGAGVCGPGFFFMPHCCSPAVSGAGTWVKPFGTGKRESVLWRWTRHSFAASNRHLSMVIIRTKYLATDQNPPNETCRCLWDQYSSQWSQRSPQEQNAGCYRGATWIRR